MHHGFMQECSVSIAAPRHFHEDKGRRMATWLDFARSCILLHSSFVDALVHLLPDEHPVRALVALMRVLVHAEEELSQYAKVVLRFHTL